MSPSIDLTPARDAETGLRFVRWFGVALALGIFLEFFVVLNAWTFIRLPLDYRGSVTIGAVLGTSTLAVFLWFACAPGACSIEFESNALILAYSASRRKRIDLSQPGRRIKLYTYPRSWANGAPRPMPYQVLFTVFPNRNPLTPEAYDRLLGWSREQQLRVDDKPWALDGSTPNHTVLIGVPRH